MPVRIEEREWFRRCVAAPRGKCVLQAQVLLGHFLIFVGDVAKTLLLLFILKLVRNRAQFFCPFAKVQSPLCSVGHGCAKFPWGSRSRNRRASVSESKIG